jgi:hypothetical protein
MQRKMSEPICHNRLKEAMEMRRVVFAASIRTAIHESAEVMLPTVLPDLF